MIIQDKASLGATPRKVIWGQTVHHKYKNIKLLPWIVFKLQFTKFNDLSFQPLINVFSQSQYIVQCIPIVTAHNKALRWVRRWLLVGETRSVEENDLHYWSITHRGRGHHSDLTNQFILTRVSTHHYSTVPLVMWAVIISKRDDVTFAYVGARFNRLLSVLQWGQLVSLPPYPEIIG